MSAIEKLYKFLSDNISCLRKDANPTFSNPKLTSLNLIQNDVASFTDVIDLAEMFPNLNTLILSDNPLLSFGDDKEVGTIKIDLEMNFVCLKRVQIYRCCVLEPVWLSYSGLLGLPGTPA